MAILPTCVCIEWVSESLSCVQLCGPMDCSLLYLSVRGILQARIRGWVVVPFSKGIFSTQGSNSDLLHGRRLLYHLNHQRSPRMLEWVANPFFSGSSRPRNLTRVSCIASGFLTGWATREAHVCVTSAMRQDWWFLRLVCLILKKTCSFSLFQERTQPPEVQAAQLEQEAMWRPEATQPRSQCSDLWMRPHGTFQAQ